MIAVHEKTGIFHLYNDQISYIMMVLPDGGIGQLYCGARLHDRGDFSWLLELGHRDMAPCVFGEAGSDGRVSWGSTTFSREHIRQEYPVFGTGDMRQGATDIFREDGSALSFFRFRGYRTLDGREELPGLPFVYTEKKEEAQTLVLELEDPLDGAVLELSYTIFRDFPVLARHAVIRSGSGPLILRKAMSLSLDLPDSDYDMVDLTGASLRERFPDRHRLHPGIQSVGSMRGHSSHQFNPFLALARPCADEKTGEVIALSLIYSGNFLAQAETDTMGVTRLMIGIHPQNFAWRLEAGGQAFVTPEALLVYSQNGLGGMSRMLHRLFRTRLARGFWRDRDRPVVINNWEATYMNFSEEKLLSIAKKAKDLGAETFVLDDGWFGRRDDDTSSLGDWYPDRRKLPDGLRGLSEKIRALGMGFGLWIEPEMVSPDSDLYRAHPDWVLGSADRPLCLGRHQLELDFSKDEVVDYLYRVLEKLIAEAGVSFIKWDMNRSVSEAWSRGRDAGWQGEVYHRQILGVYRLYECLTKRFPEVLFESCASGGGRFDPGMLYYAPQGWVSDNTDAAERVRIQYGTSIVYPLSCMSNHVSAVPNHQTGRTASMFARGAAALFGVYGCELDVTRLQEEECRQLSAQIRFVKKWRGFLREGTFYRLVSPFAGNEAGWMAVSADRRAALIFAFRFAQTVNAPYRRMRLDGLDPDTEYTVREADQETWEWKSPENEPERHFGDELMRAGLLLSDAASGVRSSRVPQGDCQARIFLAEA